MENEQNQPPQEQQPAPQSAAGNPNPNPGRRGRRRRRRRGGRGPQGDQQAQGQQPNGSSQPQGEGEAGAPPQVAQPQGQQQQGGQQRFEGGGGGRRKKRRHKHGGGGGGGEQNRGPRQNNDNRGNLINAGGRGGRGGGGGRRRGRGGPQFVGPMDHSYRQPDEMDFQPNFNGNFNGRRGNPLGLPSDHIQAVPIKIENIISAEGAPRVVVFIDDLFFHAKIREVAKKVGVNVEFAKAEKETLDRLLGEEPPALVIFDLNNANAKPLTTIPKLKAKFKKETSIVGFVQHIQGELKMKAQEAGCDMVVPRSAFSANLPNLLRRHSEAEDEVGYERGPAY